MSRMELINEMNKYFTKNKIERIANELDWRVIWDEDNISGEKLVEFEKYSPAGEDFLFTVRYTHVSEIPEKIRENYEDFDPEEHVMLWANSAGSNGVPSLRKLMEDADAIEEMIRELAVAFDDIKKEIAE